MKNQQKPPLPTLPMHLMWSLTTWLGSLSALPCAKGASPNWKAENLQALQNAVAEEAKNRASELLAGVLRYIETPYRRQVAEKPCIWKRGNARLLDYGNGDTSTPLLFIPSLINRYYVLDLEKNRSLLHYLGTQGIWPLVLDWGSPGSYEKNFDCAKYITHILLPAIEFLRQTTGKKVSLAGYCMGGAFALAAARLQPKYVSSLALLATPWNFHCKAFLPFVVDEKWRAFLSQLIARHEMLPAESIQSLFHITDPWVFEHKFRRFVGLDPAGQEAKDFIALEHWVNDGVPMTTNVARDCLIGWAQENILAKGNWSVGGKKIHPGKIKLPTFIALPKQDHVVPFDCAQPLADLMPHAHVLNPNAGHVSMIVGNRAKTELWHPFAKWFKR